MAQTLRLTDGTTTVDLLNGPLRLESGSWRTRTPAVKNSYSHSPFGAQSEFDYYEVVVETMTLFGEDEAEILISRINRVEDLLEQARLWHVDKTRTDPVWLEWEAEGENGLRRSLIYEGSLQHLSGIGISPMIQSGVMRVTLTLSRHPLWESSSPIDLHAADYFPSISYPLSNFGGIWNLQIYGGIAPGRIAHLRVSSNNVSGAKGRVWVGIRPFHIGIADFDPVMELESAGTGSYSDGELGTDASVQSDVTASGNNFVRVTFGSTEDMALRITMTMEDAVGGGLDKKGAYFGRYLVLLRYRVSSADTQAAIQLKYGYDTGHYENEKVYTDSGDTYWRLLPLGEIIIPPGQVLLDVSFNLDIRYTLASLQFQIFAERVSGAGTLDLDALCLMPSDHIAMVNDYQLPQGVWFMTLENDEVSAISNGEIGGPIQYNPNIEFSMRNFYYPTEGGVIVVAGEQDTGHDLVNNNINASISIYRRWFSYRGESYDG